MRQHRGAKDLAKLTKPGRYSVGHGVSLQISAWKTRSWVFRYARDGKQHHLGLGSVDYVPLTEAREKGIQLRRLLASGIDPLQHKRGVERERLLASTRARTFRSVAEEYVEQQERGWRGDASRKQWVQSFERWVYPVIGERLVGEIDVADVLQVLDPMRDVPVVQKRTKFRLAAVLDYAAARDLRPHDNPARRKLLAARRQAVTHLASLDYRDTPAFVKELRARPELAARGLEMLVLTAARPAEVLGMTWDEIDTKARLWTVPASRMKRGKEWRVPLSRRACELLGDLPRDGQHVFPSTSRAGHLGNIAMLRVLKRMGRADITAHGMRSSFKTWCDEQTSAPHAVVEASLAHEVGSATERAYARGELLEKRRALMQAWADYLLS